MAEVEVVKLDTQPAKTSIKELRQQLKGFKDEMAGLEEGSKEFLEVAAKAGEVKHQIDAITQSVAGASSDFGDMLASGTRAVQGIMGGFQAAQGALTLFGVESEEVTKAIQKMQASMAVIQGLDAIDNGIKGFKKFTTAIKASTQGLSGFKKALIATGIGAFVIIIGELIAHFDELDALTGGKLSKTLNGLKGVFSNLGGELKSLGKLVLDSVVAPFKTYLETIKGVGKAVKAIIKGEFGDGQLEAIVTETKDNIKSIYTDIADDAKQVGGEFADGFNGGILEAEKKAEKERKEAALKLAEEKQKEFEEYKKRGEERLDIELERNKRTNQSSEEQLQREIEIEKERLKLYRDGTLEYEQQLTKIADLESKVGEDARKAAEEKAKADEADRQKRVEQYQKDIEALQNYYLTDEELFAQNIQNKRDLLLASYEEGVIDEQTYSELSKQIDDEVTQHKLDNQKQLDEARKNDIKNTISFATQIANGAANILNQFADAQDKTNKEGFEKSKKMQIAAATIQMLTGIATAISGAFTTKSGPWDIALAALQAGMIATSAGIEINKIKKQKYESGTSNASLSGNAVSAMVIPPVEYSQAVQGASTEQTIGESKAYVAVTEIQSVGSRVEVAENESRY